MSAQGLVQLFLLLLALGLTVPPLGRYMAKVYGTRRRTRRRAGAGARSTGSSCRSSG